MSLILKKVNYSKTRTRLKKYMEEYALLSLKLEEKQLPKASGKYLLSFNGPSVLSSRNSHVENQVIDKIILEEKIVYYLEKIVQSFNKLNEEERKYIYLKYFIDKKLSDEEIQKKCYMSLRTYRNLKKSAQIKFAIALGVEMYDE